MKDKKNIPTLLLLTMAFLLSPARSSADLVGSGQISLVQPIQIQEIDRINFGTIEKPNQNVVVGVDDNGNVVGNATMLDTNSVKNGKIKIFGSDNHTINMQAYDLRTHSTIRFLTISGKYGSRRINLKSGKSNLDPPTINGTDMVLYANLRIRSNIQIGDYEPAFSVVINYD